MNLQINNFKSYDRKLIDDDSIFGLAKAFTMLPKLSDLSLSLKSNGIKDECIANFSSQLPEFINLKYLKLNFWFNKIIENGACFMAQNLQKCSNLSTLILNLQYNKIRYQGALNLSKSILNLTNLTYLKLDLRFCKIGQAGPFDVISTLANCRNLRILKLGFGENNIEDEQEELLLRKIKHIKYIVLFELNLYDDFGEISDSEEEVDEES
ncbi:hypothetical protein ABPG74_013183 [Tetrahymena malaccensis]